MPLLVHKTCPCLSPSISIFSPTGARICRPDSFHGGFVLVLFSAQNLKPQQRSVIRLEILCLRLSHWDPQVGSGLWRGVALTLSPGCSFLDLNFLLLFQTAVSSKGQSAQGDTSVFCSTGQIATQKVHLELGNSVEWVRLFKSVRQCHNLPLTSSPLGEG